GDYQQGVSHRSGTGGPVQDPQDQERDHHGDGDCQSCPPGGEVSVVFGGVQSRLQARADRGQRGEDYVVAVPPDQGGAQGGQPGFVSGEVDPPQGEDEQQAADRDQENRGGQAAVGHSGADGG